MTISSLGSRYDNTKRNRVAIALGNVRFWSRVAKEDIIDRNEDKAARHAKAACVALKIALLEAGLGELNYGD